MTNEMTTRDMQRQVALRSCLFCTSPCRFVLCDACYAKTPHSQLAEQESLVAVRGESVGLPVSFENVCRF